MYLFHNWSSWEVKKSKCFDYYRFERLSYQEKNNTKMKNIFYYQNNVNGQRLLDARNFIGHSYYIDICIT